MARFGLPLRLLFLLAASILPALAAVTYVQVGLRHDRVARVHDSAAHQAQLLSADVQTLIDSARQLTLAVAQFDDTRSLAAGCGDQLRALQNGLRGYAVLAVVSADHQVVCSAGSVLPTDLAGSVDAGLAAGHFVVGRYLRFGDGRAMLPMIQPFTALDGRRGAVVVAIDLAWLREHLLHFRNTPTSSLTVADADGTILLRLPEGGHWEGGLVVPGARSLINAAHAGVTELVGHDGLKRLVGYVPASETGGLYAAYGVYVPALLAPIDHAAHEGYALIAVCTLLTMLLMMLVTRRLVHRPTEALLNAAQRWAAGDLAARADLQVPDGSEFARLAGAYNAMAETLDARRTQLQELNASLEARVAERTQALSDTNNRLLVEINERERTDAALRISQKLQAVGQLAGGMAHEFNNLLTTVMGSLELLRLRLGQDPKLARYLDAAAEAAQRGGRLTSQLLAFARRRRLMPVAVDLNAVLAETQELLHSTLGRGIDLQIVTPTTVWPALADRHEIEAAILNLALNARDAMMQGGRLRIETRNLVLPVQDEGSGEGKHPQGDFVELVVADTGVGMTEDELAHSRDPFFTTKGPGQGAGLGLSQVHGLAQQLGGDLQIESRKGHGTTVRLLLPRAAMVASVALAEPPAREIRGSVLLVDDDDQVRQIAADMLSELGFSVTTASSGAEALALLHDTATGFAALVADYSMPGMTGIELIGRTRSLYPAMMPLLITGYMDFGKSGDSELLNASQVLRKPFTLGELARRIGEIVSCETQLA